MRSVPQLIKIWRARSADGLSVTANISEMLAYAISLSYNVRD